MNTKKTFGPFPLHPITERVVLTVQVLCVLGLATIFLTGCGSRVLGYPFPQWIGLVVVVVGVPVFWIVFGLEHTRRTHIFTERRLKAGMYLMLVVCFITGALIVVGLTAHRGPFATRFAPTPTPTLTQAATEDVWPEETKGITWVPGERFTIIGVPNWNVRPRWPYWQLAGQRGTITLASSHASFVRPCRQEEHCVATTFEPTIGMIVYVSEWWASEWQKDPTWPLSVLFTTLEGGKLPY